MVVLERKTLVVAGGAGGVGEGVVRALLRVGAHVIVPSRDRERLAALRALVSSDAAKLELVEADVGDASSCEKLRDGILAKHGAIHGVVAAVGGWWQGARLTRVPVDVWDRVFDNNLRAHWILARTFLETLQRTPGSTYTMINGSAAHAPVVEAGPSCIASAASLMLTRTLASEAKGTHVRVNALVLGPVKTRNTKGAGDPSWLTADDVGAYVAHLVSDEGSMISGAIVDLLDRPSRAPG
jgi:NAD(P)-dependent dehydrogenase (short-subunit alcohol dehydrogenase family)